MKILQITESTTSGSVASVATPIGSTQKRAGTLFKGKKTKKKFYEAPEFTTKQQVIDYFLKRGKTAAQGASAWERGYRGPKPTAKAPEHWLDRSERKQQDREDQKAVNEQELQEQDVIIVPGMRKMKDKSFIPHKADRRDHEVEMARSDLYAAAKDAMRIFKLLKNRSEDKGIMGWQQSYITLAADYLNSVADSIEYDAQMNEITGGVLAGGIGNVEEAEYKSGSGSKFVPSSTLKALDDWLLLSIKRDTAIYFGQTKKAVAIMKKIDELEDKIMTMKYGPEELALIKKELQKKNHINARSNLTGNSVAEGHADQQRKIFKKNGKPVGEVGIDRESSPGVGQWYMKCYAYDIDRSGYDSYGEAVAELKHCLKQGVAEGDVIKGPWAAGKIKSRQMRRDDIKTFPNAKNEMELRREITKFLDALYNPDGQENDANPSTTFDFNNEGSPLYSATYELINDNHNDSWIHKYDPSKKSIEVKPYSQSLYYDDGIYEQGVAEEKFGGMPYDRLQGLQDPRGHKPLGQPQGTAPKSGSTVPDGRKVDDKLKDSEPEDKIDEKKDACYSKVKGRYKVWPSAYASGALVKCRKVGAANWGNKSKK